MVYYSKCVQPNLNFCGSLIVAMLSGILLSSSSHCFYVALLKERKVSGKR